MYTPSVTAPLYLFASLASLTADNRRATLYVALRQIKQTWQTIIPNCSPVHIRLKEERLERQIKSDNANQKSNMTNQAKHSPPPLYNYVARQPYVPSFNIRKTTHFQTFLEIP
jgi:hypothetical protein